MPRIGLAIVLAVLVPFAALAQSTGFSARGQVAYDAYDRDEFTAAIAAAKDAIAADPRDAGAYEVLASSLTQGCYDEKTARARSACYQSVIDAASAAIDLGRSTSAIYVRRGVAYAELDNTGAALRDLLEATHLNPQSLQARSELAEVEHLASVSATTLAASDRFAGAANADQTRYIALLRNRSDVQSKEMSGLLFDAYLDRARWNFDRGQYARTLEDTDAMLSLQPASERALVLRGRARLELGNTEGAISSFDIAIAQKGSSIETLVWRAQAKTQAGDTAGALGDTTDAIEREPSNAFARATRGNVYAQLGKNDLALADYAVVQASDSPGIRARGYALAAKVEESAGSLDRAKADALKAVAILPNLTLALEVLMDVAYDGDHYADAIAFADRILDHEQVALAYVIRSASKFYLANTDEQYQSAIADANSALDVSPNYAGALKFRGASEYEIGKSAQAYADENRAIAIIPGDLFAHLYRGAAQYDLNHYQDAVSDLSVYLKAHPTESWALRLRAAAYDNLDPPKPELAKRDLAVELKSYPRDSFALAELGHAEYLLDHYKASIAALDRALASRADYTYALQLRGAAKFYDEDYAGAVADESAVLAKNAKDAYALRYRGAGQYYLDKYDEAVADELASIAVTPTSFAYRILGSTYYYQGKLEPAIEAETKALKILPTNTAALDRRAVAELELGRFAPAEHDATASLKIDPKNSMSLRTRSVARLRLANYAGAIGDARAALTFNDLSKDEQVQAYTVMGDAYARLGKRTESAQAYREALRVKPNDPALEKRLHSVTAYAPATAYQVAATGVTGLLAVFVDDPLSLPRPRKEPPKKNDVAVADTSKQRFPASGLNSQRAPSDNGKVKATLSPAEVKTTPAAHP